MDTMIVCCRSIKVKVDNIKLFVIKTIVSSLSRFLPSIVCQDRKHLSVRKTSVRCYKI